MRRRIPVGWARLGHVSLSYIRCSPIVSPLGAGFKRRCHHGNLSMMTVEEAIVGRHCNRAFLSKPVPRELIRRILQIAGRAPSGSNIQPWKVWVLDGAVKDEIAREISALYDAGKV